MESGKGQKEQTFVKFSVLFITWLCMFTENGIAMVVLWQLWPWWHCGKWSWWTGKLERRKIPNSVPFMEETPDTTCGGGGILAPTHFNFSVLPIPFYGGIDKKCEVGFVRWCIGQYHSHVYSWGWSLVMKWANTWCIVCCPHEPPFQHFCIH